MSASIFKKLVGPMVNAMSASAAAPKPSAPPPADPEVYSLAAIDKLADDLPPRKGVWWSAESAKEVEDKLPEEEAKAAEAAAEWAKDPSDETAAKVDEVLEEVEFQGPGSWAAQAAQWAAAAGAMGASAIPVAATAGPKAAALVPQAVAGSVKLAAAMANGQMPEQPDAPDSPADSPSDSPPERVRNQNLDQDQNDADDADDPADDPSPEELQEQAEALKPFIDKGNEIAAVDEPWK